MKRTAGLLLAAALFARGASSAQAPAAMKVAAPEFHAIEAWLNSKPVTIKDLRGRVVVLHFWAFG